MSDENKIGDINVEMGDGNTVDHIGHKFVFHAPPPSPNALHQNGRVVGEIGSEPVRQTDGSYTIEKLFVDASFDHHQPFILQGVRLGLTEWAAKSSASLGGRAPLITYWEAVCRAIK